MDRKHRATLRDLAAAAGVSLAQASHALAGYADVSPATRERVTQLARELGYRPSARARSFKAGSRSQQRCGVVILGMSAEAFGRTHFYGPVLAGLMAQAEAERMELHLIPVPQEALVEAGVSGALRRLVAEDRADGYVLLAFVPLAAADIAPLEEARAPFVLVNRHLDSHRVDAVTVDYGAGTAAAVRHLAALGHRRLALLLPDRGRSTVRDREHGWRRGIEEAGLEARAAPIHRFPDGDEPASRRLALEILRSQEVRPTAIVCHSDVTAHTVLAAAAEADVRVPDRLSVIGFDNVIARYLTPPLCTFESHPHALGARATTRLAALLRGDSGGANGADGADGARHERIEPAFVCRGTCAPARR